jgi:hypothetical protein
MGEAVEPNPQQGARQMTVSYALYAHAPHAT